MKENFIFDTGVAKAEENMRIDSELLESLKKPLLHLYRWAAPSATYGYFIDPEEWVEPKIDLARRPTGGGIVFHIWDLAFSFLLPSDHPLCRPIAIDNYRFVNQIVLEALKPFLKEEPSLIDHTVEQSGAADQFCMAKPTIYDVIYRGRKVAGAAQRRKRQGYLHQGTLSLAFPDFDLLSSVLKSKQEVMAAMAACTYAPLGPGWKEKELQELKREVEQRLISEFAKALEISEPLK